MTERLILIPEELRLVAWVLTAFSTLIGLGYISYTLNFVRKVSFEYQVSDITLRVITKSCESRLSGDMSPVFVFYTCDYDVLSS